MTAAARAATDIMESTAAADTAGYGKVFQDWKKFRADSFKWFATAEQEYERFAFAQTL
jgi:TRAP-type mannitol/chloroaromatic compound transport system substrate-binding protein